MEIYNNDYTGIERMGLKRILAENVIVGNIPSTYYNLEGLDKNTDALEVVE